MKDQLEFGYRIRDLDPYWLHGLQYLPFTRNCFFFFFNYFFIQLLFYQTFSNFFFSKVKIKS